MSNVSNLHTVLAYSGKEKPLSSQRLATVTYRTDKATGIKPESKCVSVPLFDSSEVFDNFERCASVLAAYFESTQDKIIRELIDNGKTSIHSEEIGLNACLDYLQQTASGSRLSKELLASWFEEEVEPILALTLAQKLGTDLENLDSRQEKIISGTLQRFSTWILSLAGTKTLLGNDTILQLEKCFSLVSASPLLDKLSAKLTEMKKQNSLLEDGLAL